MYFIVVKFTTRPEWTDRWLGLVADFTAATRAEPGNKWFEWCRSVDDPATFVLLEAFADDDAAAAHVNSEHFQQAMTEMRQAIVETPRIVSRKVEGDDWDRMGELQID